ncbi:purine-nucleoside phosphorylase [Silvibacterium dinghuense]|uniref:Purine nucleoside phosphorylase n=1 Tax=Silvibacterium dinghuense TaxID=1560006 RepID=A0A4Q1SI07_9BACT|nr:purine-nucleoside phosphorylase [Silvibacterium dinghuense]RXS97017.1 purine-nucleoside phosphorylase [Silvibacterium dinghuense]GGG95534.1 purine nucleoside phosphorylase [Silvibacterium dinghuense]
MSFTVISSTALYERASEAAKFLQSHTGHTPLVGVVLGSGLGGFAAEIEQAAVIPYSEIPHFPRSTVAGHSGRLLIGTVAGTPVAVMQGRVHGYEGYSAAESTFPVRVLGMLGIKALALTNAAGGIRASYAQGDLVLLSDHINLMGVNPLTGPNDERLGQRFFDMTEAYARRLRQLAHTAANENGVALQEGVYIGVPGPSFETPAEIRAFRALGADLVGMSTVLETIAARHMGIEVLGISCVTNMAAGIQVEPLNHEEVMETGKRVEGQLAAILKSALPEIAKLVQAGGGKA